MLLTYLISCCSPLAKIMIAFLAPLMLWVVGRDLQFKVDYELQIFEKLFITILFALSVSTKRVLRGNRWFEMADHCFTSNKPTHWLLDYGDFTSHFTRISWLSCITDPIKIVLLASVRPCVAFLSPKYDKFAY